MSLPFLSVHLLHHVQNVVWISYGYKFILTSLVCNSEAFSGASQKVMCSTFAFIRENHKQSTTHLFAAESKRWPTKQKIICILMVLIYNISSFWLWKFENTTGLTERTSPLISHWTYSETFLKIWTKSLDHSLGCINIKLACQIICNLCSQGLTKNWHSICQNPISLPVSVLIYPVACSLAVDK